LAHRALAANRAISNRRVLLTFRCLRARAFSIATLRSSSVKLAHRFLDMALAALETSISFFLLATGKHLNLFAIFYQLPLSGFKHERFGN